jgi:hypothetical protein
MLVHLPEPRAGHAAAPIKNGLALGGYGGSVR